MAKREYDRRRYKEQIARGMCSWCRKRPSYRGATKCDECILALSAKRNLGSSNRVDELRNLLQSQHGRCAYTGRELTLGGNASIEHIEPRSKARNREVDIRNIKWVDKDINRMKGAMPLHDFLMACKEVLRFFGYTIRRDGE